MLYKLVIICHVGEEEILGLQIMFYKIIKHGETKKHVHT